MKVAEARRAWRPPQGIDPDGQEIILDDGVQDEGRSANKMGPVQRPSPAFDSIGEACQDRLSRRSPEFLPRPLDELSVFGLDALLHAEPEVALEAALQVALQGIPCDLLAHVPAPHCLHGPLPLAGSPARFARALAGFKNLPA